MALIGLGIAALVGAAGVVGATQFGDTQRVVPRGTGGGGEARATSCPEKGGPLAAPVPDRARRHRLLLDRDDPAPGHALPRARAARSACGSRPKTEWGSARVLGRRQPARRLARRAGVGAQERRDRLDQRASATSARLRQLVAARRPVQAELHVRHDGKTVRKLHVAIGRKDNPTPKGRFSVTDRLQVTSAGLALRLLRARADRPPDQPAALLARRRPAGRARDQRRVEHRRSRSASAACARTRRQARWLINHIPLGSPVFIHA